MSERPPANEGKPLGWTPTCEADHYVYCPKCRQWFDMRDLGEVFEHLHGKKIRRIRRH